MASAECVLAAAGFGGHLVGGGGQEPPERGGRGEGGEADPAGAGVGRPPPRLAELRARIRKADRRFYLAHYSYAKLVPTQTLEGDELAEAMRHNHKTIGKFRHWAHYVTRSTFLRVAWAPDVADQITETRFHSTWTWGGAERWQGPMQWGSETDHEDGGCPVCHGRIHWDHIELTQGVLFGAVEMGRGLWVLFPSDDSS